MKKTMLLFLPLLMLAACNDTTSGMKKDFHDTQENIHEEINKK